jgi:hypothetical protein
MKVCILLAILLIEMQGKTVAESSIGFFETRPIQPTTEWIWGWAPVRVVFVCITADSELEESQTLDCRTETFSNNVEA